MVSTHSINTLKFLKDFLISNGYNYITSLNCWNENSKTFIKEIMTFLHYEMQDPQNWTSAVWRRDKWILIHARKYMLSNLILIYDMQKWHSIAICWPSDTPNDFRVALSYLSDQFIKKSSHNDLK